MRHSVRYPIISLNHDRCTHWKYARNMNDSEQVIYLIGL
jgi:hypothetical protein